ncbi:hypothetical protein ES703_96499 [subsurface metagenome]
MQMSIQDLMNLVLSLNFIMQTSMMLKATFLVGILTITEFMENGLVM